MSKITLNQKNMAKFANANNVRLYIKGEIFIDKGHVEIRAFNTDFAVAEDDTEIFVVTTLQRNLVELDGFTELESDCSIRKKDINQKIYAFEVLDI